MKVIRCSLPTNSLFNKGSKPDYLDCFQLITSDKDNFITPSSLGKSFFTSAPKWIQNLFEFREKLAKIVGLKTGKKKAERQKALDAFHCEPGQQLGLFKVLSKTDNEVILGEDDKHLNFRISITVERLNGDNKKVTLSTWVHFNNFFGKLYFIPVKPFHKLIVPSMMKAMVKESSKNN